MRPDEILDYASRVFTRHLYPELLAGCNVHTAFTHACNAVRTDETLLETVDPKTWQPVNWDQALKFCLLPPHLNKVHDQPLTFETITGDSIFPTWANTNLHAVSSDPFVGRQEAIHDLAKHWHQSNGPQCIMLHGMGGMGKTALAEATGRWQHERNRWPDGVWFIDLRNIPDAAQVRDNIAAITSFAWARRVKRRASRKQQVERSTYVVDP